MNFCRFCQKCCGQREFCDEYCYAEYEEDANIRMEAQQDDLPGESRYAGDFGEVEEWDVEGGL